MVIYSTVPYFLNFTPQLTRCRVSLRTAGGHVAQTHGGLVLESWVQTWRFQQIKKQDSTTVGLKKKRSHGWIINEINDTEKSVQKSFRYFTEDFLLKFEIFLPFFTFCAKLTPNHTWRVNLLCKVIKAVVLWEFFWFSSTRQRFLILELLKVFPQEKIMWGQINSYMI